MVVGHEVIRVFQRDRAIEVGEEDNFRVRVEGLWERHGEDEADAALKWEHKSIERSQHEANRNLKTEKEKSLGPLLILRHLPTSQLIMRLNFFVGPCRGNDDRFLARIRAYFSNQLTLCLELSDSFILVEEACREGARQTFQLSSINAASSITAFPMHETHV